MKRNILVGVVTVLAIVFIYYGMDFLKGASVFSTTNTYYATYDEMGGLVSGAPVYVKGYKVGQVDAITYDLEKNPSFLVGISVESDVKLPHGSVIELFDDGLLGGRAVQLVLPDAAHRGAEFYVDSDTIPSSSQSGLLSAAGNLVPKLESAVEHADSLIVSANTLINSDELQSSMQNIKTITTNFTTVSKDFIAVSADIKRISGNATAITEDFKVASRDAKQLVARVNSEMPAIMQNAKSTMANLNKISSDLDVAEVNSTIASAKTTLQEVNTFVEKLNSGDGTVGLLLNDKELYNNLSKTAGSANELVVDLKANPRRYVHFSLFGGKDKSDKTSKKKK